MEEVDGKPRATQVTHPEGQRIDKRYPLRKTRETNVGYLGSSWSRPDAEDVP